MTSEGREGREGVPAGGDADDGRRIPIKDKRVLAQEDAPGSEAEAEEDVLEAEARAGQAQQGTEEPGAVSIGKQLEEAEQLAADRLDQLMRLKADFENYRKRVIREQTEMVDTASLRIVEKLLGVLDDFDRALDAARDHEGSEPWVKGLELVERSLSDIIAAEGLEKIRPAGETFDPHQHEAVSSVPGDVDEPTVLEVVRPGYRMKGKTIRPALVHVSTPDEGEGEE